MLNVYIFDDTTVRPNSLHKAIQNCFKENISLQPVQSEVFNNRNNCFEETLNDTCYSCSDELVTFHAVMLPAICFVHGSNKCSYRFMQNYINNSEVVIVCYSGDIEHNISYLEIMAGNPNNIKGYNLPLGINVDEVTKQWDLDRFIYAVYHKETDPFQFLARKGKLYISALSILCLGFLAQHGQLGELPIGLNITNGLNSADAWKKVLGETPDGVIKNLELNTSEISKLVDRIFESSDLSVIDVNLVKSAFNTLPGCSI